MILLRMQFPVHAVDVETPSSTAVNPEWTLRYSLNREGRGLLKEYYIRLVGHVVVMYCFFVEHMHDEGVRVVLDTIRF